MRVSIGLVVSTFLCTVLFACGPGGSKGWQDGDDGNVSGGGNSGNGGSAGSSMIPTVPGGPVANPCESPMAPPNCVLEPSGPACGDGLINLMPAEACDDGNTKPGDGCTGTCVVEPDYVCPTPGMPCVSTIVCGDGMQGRGEACDDGNTADGDGCASTCRTIEPHYVCRMPGMPCTEVHLCGDGRLDSNEGCDDGGVMAGDGCSARCQMEIGWKCSGNPSMCTRTTCGDGTVEGAESCDDRNTIGFDGCAPNCRLEPECPGSMGECTSSCGDGIVLDEGCDDGNKRNGDGCSDRCTVEDGFMCDNTKPCEMVDGSTACSMTVPVVFRDFNAQSSGGGHPDFQPGYNHEGVTQGLVQTTLDNEGKPVLSSAANVSNAFMHGPTQFAQWYRNGAPASAPIPGTIRLWDNARGGYVNRWGQNGEQWRGYPQGTVNGVTYPNPQQCGQVDCTECADPPMGMVCLDDCFPWGNNTQACFAAEVLYDGSPLFFPIDPPRMGILNDTRLAAKVPEQYGWNGWPGEVDVATRLGFAAMPFQSSTAPFPSATHNFAFTTEVKYWFKYEAATAATLDFTGDDDVWVFVNGRLTVDLGAWHVPLNGSVTLQNGRVTSTSYTTLTGAPVTTMGTAAQFGLEDGKVYLISVFHAERQSEGSSFKLTLSGFNLVPSECKTNCGDGEVGAGEECDDGPGNLGGYNQCTADCRIGPRCGDAVVQMDVEACDDGMNLGEYGVGCGPNCQPSPFCGDGVTQPEHEVCDDGMNQVTYGGCAPGCILGPYCGDGQRQIQFEECDDGNNVNMDGCSSACKLERPITR
jgi:fibro-slime domain-containing protein